MNSTADTIDDTSWFVRDRFGLFIHWGLYAQAARHEWVQNYEQIPGDVYEATYCKRFDPDLYDPELWAKTAAEAGMKYFVVTTKHHEGFCLWDSKLTDYKSTNTARGRDLLRPMIEAFRQENFRVGLYHSLLDWHHPDFTIDDEHALRHHPDKAKLNAPRTWSKYVEYLHGQIRELLTELGRIDLLFMDFSYPPGKRHWAKDFDGKGKDYWKSEKLYKMIRDLAPKIMLNDRLDLDDGWDFKTPEQFQPRGSVTHNGNPVAWEACQTMSGSWGYHRDESTWKSLGQLLRMLIDTVSKGGNLILNVGPTARGEFDERALDRLAGIGRWMRKHSRSIYGCTQAPLEMKTPQDCRLTYNPDTRRLYIHVFAWPFQYLYLEGMAGKVAYAQLLNDASEVKMTLSPWVASQTGDGLEKDTVVLDLPVVQPDVTVPVIELYLK